MLFKILHVNIIETRINYVDPVESINMIKVIHSTSTRPGEEAIYQYLSRQGKIAGDIHETKSSGLSLS